MLRNASLLAPALVAILLAPVAAADATQYVEPNDPTASELVDALVARAEEYATDFDPNDNATVLKEKTQGFAEDVATMVFEAIAQTVCQDFHVGLNLNDLGVKPDPLTGSVIMEVPGYGKDKETGEEGIGVLTITIVLTGSCGSILPRLDDIVEEPASERIMEELVSVWNWFGFPSSPLCC